MKKSLSICCSPYQVFNALNFAWHQGCREDFDICIVDQFADAKGIVKKLQEKKLFSNVYISPNPPEPFMPRGLKRYFSVMLRYILPKRNLKLYKLPAEKGVYDNIFTTGGRTDLLASLLIYNPKAKVNLFDDGTGSYHGDIVKSIMKGRLHKIFYSIFSRLMRLNDKPQKMYVNNTAICKTDSAKEIASLPEIDKEFLSFANDVFSIDTAKKIKKIIWCAQNCSDAKSVSEIDSFFDSRKNVAAALKNFIDNITVRLHADDKQWVLFQEEKFDIDYGEEFWELKILNQDMNNVILISAFSTASMTPKILFNMEPFLIFTYPLYHQYEPWKKRFETIAKLIQDIKNSYSDPSKVVVVNNTEELQLAIDHFLKLGAKSHE